MPNPDDEIYDELQSTPSPAAVAVVSAEAKVSEGRDAPIEYATHEIAETLAPLRGHAFEEMVNNTKKHGQTDSIVLFEGQVLAGRDAYRACKKAGVTPQLEQYQGNEPARVFVDRITGRHLKGSQRAVVAARLVTVKHGGNRCAEQDANCISINPMPQNCCASASDRQRVRPKYWPKVSQNSFAPWKRVCFRSVKPLKRRPPPRNSTTSRATLDGRRGEKRANDHSTKCERRNILHRAQRGPRCNHGRYHGSKVR
jgi:hypothetical protein